MGLGSTAKKIQTLADRAEQLYKQLNDVRDRLLALEESATETTETVAEVEREVEKNRAILTALAEQEGLDVEQILADAAIETVDEGDAGAESTPESSATATSNGVSTSADETPDADDTATSADETTGDASE